MNTASTAVGAPYVEGVTGSGVHWRMGPWRAAGDERHRRLLAHSWTRELIAERFGLDSARFAPTAPGRKPQLLGLDGVDVSISHGDHTLLVAVAAHGLVGVDVEDEPFAAFERATLVRRMCSPAERADLEAVPLALRTRALARAWVLKEATLKARGIGLAVDPRTVCVDVAALAVARPTVGPERAIVHVLDRSVVIAHP